MTERLERAYPYLLLSTALLPLVFFDGMLYPYMAPKTLLLRGIAIVAFALFSYLALTGKSFFFDRLRQPVNWIPAALLTVAYLSSALGAEFYHGFWSTFDRGDGLISLTAIVVLYYLFLLHADEAFYVRFLRLVSWTGTLVAAYGFLQWIATALQIRIPLVAAAHGRVGSTLGNAAFLSGYLGITLFVTLAVAWRSQGGWRTFWYASAGVQVLVILITATRGAILALVVAALVALLYGAFAFSGRVRTYTRLALAVLAIAATLFFAFRAEVAKVPITFVQRVATISFADATVSSRLFIWVHILPEAMKHPILGTGAETIETIFNRIYDPGKILEQWFDRSHNSFLDYLVQYGILGLLLYSALIVGVAYGGLRRYRMGEKEGLLFILLALTYAVSDFFVFDTTVVFALLAVLAALVASRNPSSVAPRRAPRVSVRSPFVPSALGIAILLLLVPVSITPLRANLMLADGYMYHVVDVRRANASMEAGLALNTYADLEYGYQAYDMYTERQQVMLSGEARVLAYEYAREVLQENFNKYPQDARTATYLGHVLDAAPPEVKRDEESEREVLTRAIALSPKRPQAWYILANIPLRKGDALPPGSPGKIQQYQEAISIVEGYAKIVPRTSEPRYILATLYLTVGDLATAKRWADEALPLYVYDGSLSTAKRASKYYINVGDWVRAEKFLWDVVRTVPDDHTARYDFAKAAFLAGNEEKGIAAAAIVKEKDPELFASDPAFMQAYNAWIATHQTP